MRPKAPGSVRRARAPGRGGARYAVVMVTTPDRRTSERLSRLLVEGRWAACVNRIPGIQSRYRWKGRVETAREELLLVKTLSAKVRGLEAAVRKAHPCAVCEVLALPVRRGSAPYLAWIDRSLRPPGRMG